jgi:hypothetical protein
LNIVEAGRRIERLEEEIEEFKKILNDFKAHLEEILP